MPFRRCRHLPFLPSLIREYVRSLGIFLKSTEPMLFEPASGSDILSLTVHLATRHRKFSGRRSSEDDPSTVLSKLFYPSTTKNNNHIRKMEGVILVLTQVIFESSRPPVGCRCRKRLPVSLVKWVAQFQSGACARVNRRSNAFARTCQTTTHVSALKRRF